MNGERVGAGGELETGLFPAYEPVHSCASRERLSVKPISVALVAHGVAQVEYPGPRHENGQTRERGKDR